MGREISSAKKLILASKSPRRREILEELGVDFLVMNTKVEEVSEGESPSGIAVLNAKLKAEAVKSLATFPFISIGVDTIVVKGDEVFGKPENEQEAFRMLSSLRNGYHEVISGIAIYDSVAKEINTGYEVTKVKMWDFPDEMIRKYISTGEPLDKAGAYGIQGKGRVLIERIEGCYFNVVGLPIYLLQKMLFPKGIFLL